MDNYGQPIMACGRNERCEMSTAGVLACFEQFRVNIKLCTDKTRDSKMMPNATGKQQLFVQLYDEKLLAWGAEYNVKVPLLEDSSEVMSIELKGALSTASKVKFTYRHKDIMCMEMLQLESLDKTTTFNLIQVTKLFYQTRYFIFL